MEEITRVRTRRYLMLSEETEYRSGSIHSVLDELAEYDILADFLI